MIDTAIILAAGAGTRFKGLKKPKAMLNVGGHRLIDYSIAALAKHGVTKIVIGTGFSAEAFDGLQVKHPSSIITLVNNPDWQTNGSLKTFYKTSVDVFNGVLILDSDILYDERAISLVLNDTRENVVLIGSEENQRDGAYVSINEDARLREVSKEPYYPCPGVLVGIAKVSSVALNELKTFASFTSTRSTGDWHHDWAYCCLKSPFYAHIDRELIFGEADDDDQLLDVMNRVYPKATLCL